ncbi:unnamed protein product, partial [Ectocarpus sp. 12 AP-2014]
AATEEEDLVQCAKCGVRVHRKCYGVPEGVGGPGAGKGEKFVCAPCTARVSQPSCTLCPRKGGAFLRIKGSQYCHAYCAERTPGARVVDPFLPPPPPPSPPPRGIDDTTPDGGGGGGAPMKLEGG